MTYELGMKVLIPVNKLRRKHVICHWCNRTVYQAWRTTRCLRMAQRHAERHGATCTPHTMTLTDWTELGFQPEVGDFLR